MERKSSPLVISSHYTQNTSLVLFRSWSCYFSLPNIHPSVTCCHSCCVLVAPSGISRLPLAFSLLPPSFHTSSLFSLSVFSTSVSSISISLLPLFCPPSLFSLPPDLPLCSLSVTVYLCSSFKSTLCDWETC